METAVFGPGCRAAFYIRLSKEDESEGPSQSVTNQRALLEEFARKKALQVCGVYVDDGWSGTRFDRPAFQRMLKDIEAKQVNLVLTKDLSRLGRDYILTGYYLERYFPEHRVRYVSLLDGIDTGVESSANDITPFRAIMNDLYAKDISQRSGQFIGGKPVYGYRMHPTEKNKIVVDDEAAITVRRIFAMALEGLSCRAIAARLNEEAVPPPAVYASLRQGRSGPYSGRWSSERISEMLRNETYIGSMVQGRQVKLSYKSKKCLRQRPEQWIVVPGTHEPLIDGETFRRVGELVASRRHTRSRTYDFLLKGLIFCHECGHPLGVLNRPNAKGEDVLYFVCRTYQRFAKSGVCTSHAIKEQTVTEAVAAAVEAQCRQWLRTENFKPGAEAALRQAAEAGRQEEDPGAVERKRAALTQKLDRVYEDRLAGLLPEADFRRILAKIQEERERLQSRAVQLRRREEQGGQEELADRLVETFFASVGRNREVLVNLVERIELTKDRQVIVFFRFSKEEAAGEWEEPVSEKKV